ncbi:MFS transporter [Actinokineospora diospyrosa]|uniref:Arabinose efflux permease, MFS family n=1 Tax=Actinokineospora diospyrosa TaxID=103728 RepID=A0ABT1ILF8_9PSEU|nr:MFS transporter [Actinokineospora diospyrosa]MCP2273490.1 putative arabinose efflux permease, MFS family [Actinokineospora diospyrosa]
MFEAFGVRDFRLLWFARLVSQLGSWLLVVAVPVQVFVLSGSVTATGLTVAAEFLPGVVLGPVVGVWVDRWDRRRVMVVADLVRGVAVGLLLVVQGVGELWLVYVVLVVESSGTVLFRPAAQAHTPVVVGTGSRLSSANALNAATDGVVRLVGAAAGGALLGWVGFEALVVLDAGSYVVSAVAILSTAARGGGGTGSTGRVWVDLRWGLEFLRSNKTARGVLAVTSLFLGANACLSALLIPFGVTVLGGGGQIGIVLSALGVGFLVGAPVMRGLVDRVEPGPLLGGAVAATGVGFIALFSASTVVAAVPAAVGIGVVGSVALGTAQTVVQRVTPNEGLGRVSSVVFTGEAVATVVGAVVGPAVAQALSLTWAAYLAGAVTVLGGLAGWAALPRAAGQ